MVEETCRNKILQLIYNYFPPVPRPPSSSEQELNFFFLETTRVSKASLFLSTKVSIDEDNIYGTSVRFYFIQQISDHIEKSLKFNICKFKEI